MVSNMSEIMQSLKEQGCTLKEATGPNNSIQCSNSFIQKYADMPWSVFVHRNNLRGLKEKIIDLDGLEISKVGMGGLNEVGAWSKIKRFDIGKHVDVNITDNDLFNSDIDDEGLKRKINRAKRISKNFFADYPIINVGKVAETEISEIQKALERKIEDKYSEKFGNTICSSTSEARRMWMPTKNDVLQFQITVKCLLPNDVIDKVNESIDEIGNRETFQTVHRDGIESILTPDKQMFLRKIALHDNDLGGPFAVFGMRNEKGLKEKTFVDKLKGMESALSPTLE